MSSDAPTSPPPAGPGDPGPPPAPAGDRAGSSQAERFARQARQVLDTVNGHVLGQETAVDALMAAYLAGGHALLEGVPGLGKTLLARVFAATLGVDLARVQFTPDLMPADVVGTNVFNQQEGGFHLVKGPIFTQILMADEINRTPPKTQAALLEAMQERQVTIDGTTYPLDGGFFVVATQNPLEFEGVYPLPEAQLDRFLLRIEMSLPTPEAEVEIYRRAMAGRLAGWARDVALPEPVVALEEAEALRGASRQVHVREDLLSYMAQLAAAVRDSVHVELGPSPRGVLSLLEAARGAALIEERDFVAPDDVKRLLVPCWGHRLLLTAESELEGYDARRILDEVAAEVEVPH